MTTTRSQYRKIELENDDIEFSSHVPEISYIGFGAIYSGKNYFIFQTQYKAIRFA
jgi:hypothetical protein